ncbi:hypothetical protein M23134_05368 [Microscilla marina ATCC 23134]|uniref:Uncharacterized protein n=1 Tax=Microscilla marina ATCC 23134 TaxID=313606 RepID=A1ZHM8_MICM2|nr:hypothetical protein M23134_05368 [Microscilla marina ATCC 23134]
MLFNESYKLASNSRAEVKKKSASSVLPVEQGTPRTLSAPK